MAVIDYISVATEVAALLEAQEWNPAPVEVKRVYVPRMDKDSLQGLRFYVMGTSQKNIRNDRSRRKIDVEVQICIAKRLAANGVEEVDPLAQLTINLAKFFENRKLSTTAVFEDGIEITAYDFDRLKSGNTFLSMVTVSLGGIR